MAKFKVGDRIRVISKEHGSSHDWINVGDTGTVQENDRTNPYLSIDRLPERGGICIIGSEDNLELLEVRVNYVSSMKEKFIQLFLSEPEKTFRKAGITNGDGLLTSDGQAIFLSYLLKKNGDDFKATVVDLIVADQEKDK